MRVEVTSADPARFEADVLAIPVAAGVTPKDSRLARLAQAELPREPGSTAVVHLDGDSPAARVTAVGIGPADGVDADAVRTAAAAISRQASLIGGSVAWQLDESLPLPLEEQARAVVEGVVLGSYEPGQWKSTPSERREIETLTLLAPAESSLGGSAERAARVAGWVNRARDLANMPPNVLDPERLAARAQEIAGEVENITVEAFGRAQLDEMGMGSFAAVARGSRVEPQLIVMRYAPPGAKGSTHLGLVGKAITFDSGGISIKPAARMQDMKGDMAGGAAVIEGTGAVADLGLPVRTTAVVASCENLPGGDAFRPGDILTAMNGKTIEITNTDAEGRLVLADALHYCRMEGATHMLDLATLTGAMELALGDLYAGLFANDDEWRTRVLDAAKASGDHAWPFPLHPRYRRYVDSAFADMKNSSELRQGSPALAAEFLQEFAGEGPWAHIDMAGPGFLERSRGDYLTQRGGTGYGVRLIVELAASLA